MKVAPVSSSVVFRTAVKSFRLSIFERNKSSAPSKTRSSSERFSKWPLCARSVALTRQMNTEKLELAAETMKPQENVAEVKG